MARLIATPTGGGLVGPFEPVVLDALLKTPSGHLRRCAKLSTQTKGPRGARVRLHRSRTTRHLRCRSEGVVRPANRRRLRMAAESDAKEVPALVGELQMQGSEESPRRAWQSRVRVAGVGHSRTVRRITSAGTGDHMFAR